MNLRLIPWSDAIELMEDLVMDGMADDEAIERTAVFLDSLVKADVLIPEPYGAIIEMVDGEALELMLRLLWRWAQNSEERRENRAIRQDDRAKRRAAREERRNSPRAPGPTAPSNAPSMLAESVRGRLGR